MRKGLIFKKIKKIIAEEFGKIKDPEKVEPDEPEGGWGDTDLEHEIDWMKSLKISEVFFPNKKKKKK